MSVTDVIETLEGAPRQGAAVDDPEGSRYVFSDTAMNAITRELHLPSAERLHAEYFGGRWEPQ